MVGIAAIPLGIAVALRQPAATGSDAGAVAVAGLADAATTTVAVTGADAAAVAAAVVDAGAGEVAVDAGAETVAALGEGDAGVRAAGDVGREDPSLPRALALEVAVTTRPSGGSLYVGGLAAGTDGTTFRRPRGTKLEVRCLFPGNDRWEPGTVRIVFDGSTPAPVCRMARKTRCVKDLHNPFRTCPD
jgi:hypothetical protein